MIQFITFTIHALDANYDILKNFNITMINYIATSHHNDGYTEYHIQYNLLTISQTSILLDFIMKYEHIENVKIG